MKIVTKLVTPEIYVREEFSSVFSLINYSYRVEFDTESYPVKPHVVCYAT